MFVSFSNLLVFADLGPANYPKTWVNIGETIQLSVPSGFASVTWSSSNTSIAEVKSYTGEVTGISRGSVTITANCRYANGSEDTYTTNINVYDSRGVVDGAEYCILNIKYDTVLSLANSSTNNNTDINLSTRSWASTKQWKLTQQSTGLYTIASVLTPTTKGMCVNSVANDVYLYTLGSTKTNFEIIRSDESDYQGLYLISYGSRYLASSSTDTVYLTGILDENCYWSFSRADKGSASLFSFDYSDSNGNNFDTSEHNSIFADKLITAGYRATAYKNQNSLAGKNALIADDVFIFSGHYSGSGNSNGSLYFYNSSGTEAGRIVASSSLAGTYSNRYSVPDLSSNGSNALASLRCVLYLACNTATDYGNANLAEATYNEGAHMVLGTTSVVQCNDTNNFLDGFLDGVSSGSDLFHCIIMGLDRSARTNPVDGYPMYYPTVYFGDIDQYLS